MKFLSTLFFLLFVCYSAKLQAQGAKLSVQGVLRNADGSAVDNGKYDLTFKLYTTQTGGAQEWVETQTDVNLNGGIYSVLSVQ